MVCKLITFAPAFLKLLMFEICGFIGISKINFFNFTGNQSVKQNQKKLKQVQTHLIL